MNIREKKIGIWGLGIVGRSAVNFLMHHASSVNVMDKKVLNEEEQQFLATNHVSYMQQNNLEQFFALNDLILASPGIDVRPFKQYHHKLITELDIVAHYFKKPIIAITGTVGKTTVTHFLSTLLQHHGLKIATGGNIGTGMLDLIAQQDTVDYAVLEVSSFQLEHCKSFAPDLAIWTNVYPNHLDRHSTHEEYLHAKMNIFMQQQAHQQSLLPLELASLCPPDKHSAFFSMHRPSDNQRAQFQHHKLFWIEDNQIFMAHNHRLQSLINLEDLPAASFIENWLIIVAALTLLSIPLPTIMNTDVALHVPEHRLEKVATINGITFYNDSKSTITQSTLKAVEMLKGHGNLIVLLGGINKADDPRRNREELIKALVGTVSYSACFGKEAAMLHELCENSTMPSGMFNNLDEAFQACVQQAKSGDTILLSPGGSSYDLFAHYQERGKKFKTLVYALQH